MMKQTYPNLSKYLRLSEEIMLEERTKTLTHKTFEGVANKQVKLSVYKSKKVSAKYFSDYKHESTLCDMNTNRKVIVTLPSSSHPLKISVEIVGATSRTRLFLSRVCRGPSGSNLLEERVSGNLTKQYEFMVKIDRNRLGYGSYWIRINIADESKRRTILYSDQMLVTLNENLFRTSNYTRKVYSAHFAITGLGNNHYRKFKSDDRASKKKIVSKM